MTVTIDLDEAESIHLTDAFETAARSARIRHRGTSHRDRGAARRVRGFDPGSRPNRGVDRRLGPVEIDLTGPATLRLENADVGIATPDSNDVPSSLDALRSEDNGFGSAKIPPDVIAFLPSRA